MTGADTDGRNLPAILSNRSLRADRVLAWFQALATLILSLRDKSTTYPTSQQAGIGARSSSSNTTIKTKARQRIKAHQRPESNLGTASLGSHGNILVTYRSTSIPRVSIRSALEDPNAASQAAHTGDSVLFSSPQTGHWPALGSGFTDRNINPILGPQQLN
jgi:hypothetical protein